MRKLLFSALLFFCVTIVYAQDKNKDWVEMMAQPNANVFEVEAAFNDFWGDRKYQKGKSFKQFQRWKKLVMPYTDEKGNIHRSHEIQEVVDYYKKNPIQKKQGEWRNLGPILPTPTGIGRLNSITFHPTNQNIMFGGSSSGGLWRSRNNGDSWSPTTDDLPSLGVSDLAIHPTDPQIMQSTQGMKKNTCSIGF